MNPGSNSRIFQFLQEEEIICVFSAILVMHGVVAHLGERIAGSDEVESSSLFGSTVKKGESFGSPLFMGFFKLFLSIEIWFGTDF